jgi:hypothetical protein
MTAIELTLTKSDSQHMRRDEAMPVLSAPCVCAPCIPTESPDCPQRRVEALETTWPYATVVIVTLTVLYAIEVVVSWLDIGQGLYILEGVSSGCLVFNATLLNPVVGDVQSKIEQALMTVILLTSGLMLGLVLRSLRTSPPKDVFALLMFGGIILVAFLVQLAAFLSQAEKSTARGANLGLFLVEVCDRIGP